MWIANIRAGHEPDVSYWDTQEAHWKPIPARSRPPVRLNARLEALPIGAEMGIPVLADGECVGIAWLKFEQFDHRRPDKNEMLLATRVAESAGQLLRHWPANGPSE